MERPKMPRLKWPSKSELDETFYPTEFNAIPYQETLHGITPERKSELLRALDRAGVGIIRLDDPGAAATIAELRSKAGLDWFPCKGIGGCPHKTGFHVTDRLTHAVLSGHYITKPELLPFSSYYDHFERRDNTQMPQFPPELRSFCMTTTFDRDYYRPENYMSDGSMMNTLLKDVGVRLSAHEESMAKDSILLGINLTGYRVYEKATGRTDFILDQGSEILALAPPPPKYVKPLALLTPAVLDDWSVANFPRNY
jgi:hypothetical protein